MYNSASVENELYSNANQVLGASPLRARVPALFAASTSSYAPESPLTLGHSTDYARGTVDSW